MDDGRALGRHVQAHRPLPLLLPAVAGGRPVDLLVGTDVIGGRRRAVGVPGVQQRLQRFAVAGRAVGLQDRPLVPVELQPAQRVEDLLDVLRRGALAVGVLDPQHQLAVVVARQQPVEQGRAGAADVQRTRGRRRETDPHDPVQRSGGEPRRRLACAAGPRRRAGALIMRPDADRRPRVPRRRPAERRRAGRGARLRVDPDLQPVARACGRAACTPTRRRARSARPSPRARSRRS